MRRGAFFICTACSAEGTECRGQKRKSKIKIEESPGDSQVIKRKAEKSVNAQKMGFLRENFENGVDGDTDSAVFIGLWRF